MNLWNSISSQLAKPHGLFGKLIVGRFLDRANADIHALVYDTLEPGSKARVLEVGFGGGALMFRIARNLDGGCIDGVDLSSEMLEVAQKKVVRTGLGESIGLHLGSVDALPFADATFDCAYSVHTIYFWPDLHRGLAELGRVIKPGGKLVLGFSGELELRQGGRVEYGFKAFSNQQITDAYRANGFEPGRRNQIEHNRRGSVYVLSGIKS